MASSIARIEQVVQTIALQASPILNKAGVWHTRSSEILVAVQIEVPNTVANGDCAKWICLSFSK
jgi:hypothetical protein